MSSESVPRSEGIDNESLSEQKVNHRTRQLPASLYVLLISNDSQLANAIDSSLRDFHQSSTCKVFVRLAESFTQGLAQLRTEAFDTVLLQEPLEVGRLQNYVDSIRTVGAPDQAVIVVGSKPARSIAESCFECGADAYVDLTTTTKAILVWTMARAAKRQKLIAENQRLKNHQVQQTSRQAEEAMARWTEQSALVDVGELVGRSWPSEDLANLRGYYREVLQAHIIMGTGQPGAELERLTELFTEERITASQLMQMHLAVVHDTMQELGERCARHVVNRADGLVMNLLMRLADGYHQRGTTAVDRKLSPKFDELGS